MSPSDNSSVHRYGLTEICSPESPLVDVVFVHGLNGHPHDTWTTHGKSRVFWPQDILAEDLKEEQCRILVHGYDANVVLLNDGASKDRIHDHAETFAQHLAANRKKAGKQRPIIFVCHSLGGLVVKRMLILGYNAQRRAQEDLRSIYISTYGILFLGTPHHGSSLAKWAVVLRTICATALPRKLFDSSPELVKALEKNSETLELINRDFLNFMERFRIYCFYEGKPTDLKGTRQFVVGKESAVPQWVDISRSGIEKDHSNMCKFENRDEPGYALIAHTIQQYAADALHCIALRWKSERRDSQNRLNDFAIDLSNAFDLGDQLRQQGERCVDEQALVCTSPHQKRLEVEPNFLQYEVKEYENDINMA